MNLDISFCYNLKCKNKKCERNINNLPPYARRIKPELSFCKYEECEEYREDWRMECPECKVKAVEQIAFDHNCSNGNCKMIKVKLTQCPSCGRVFKREEI